MIFLLPLMLLVFGLSDIDLENMPSLLWFLCLWTKQPAFLGLYLAEGRFCNLSLYTHIHIFLIVFPLETIANTVLYLVSLKYLSGNRNSLISTCLNGWADIHQYLNSLYKYLITNIPSECSLSFLCIKSRDILRCWITFYKSDGLNHTIKWPDQHLSLSWVCASCSVISNSLWFYGL